MNRDTISELKDALIFYYCYDYDGSGSPNADDMPEDCYGHIVEFNKLCDESDCPELKIGPDDFKRNKQLRKLLRGV